MKKVKTLFLVDANTEDVITFKKALPEIDQSLSLIHMPTCEAVLSFLNTHQTLTPDFILVNLNLPDLPEKECFLELRKVSRLDNTHIVIYSTSGDTTVENFSGEPSVIVTDSRKFESLRAHLKSLLGNKWS